MISKDTFPLQIHRNALSLFV
uniref:Uncharacterized protein n=1 Tax=Arundo donax TaxID=35708 RepID=A0A0A9B2X6_ARUDO